MNLSLRGALLGSAAFCGLLAAQPASATVISHNGTVGSTPAGSGAVNVFLSCSNEVQLDTCTKDFFAIATHSMTVVDPTVISVVQETVFNDSGVPWTDFHFGVTGATVGEVSITGLPQGITVQPTFGPTSIDMVFSGGTIGSEQSFQIDFTLLSSFEGPLSAVVTQAPSIAAPEPASLTLMGAGLAGLAALRRRRRAEA